MSTPLTAPVSILGRTVNRRTTAPRWSLVSLTIACIMFIASAAISESSLNRSRAKIALLYLGIFIQLAVIGAQALYGVQVPAREGHLSNQYGSLTMTILYVAASRDELTAGVLGSQTW